MALELGPKIRSLRLDRGLTATEVAARAGLTVSNLSQIERGLTSPSLSSLRRIATALGVPAFQLLIEEMPLEQTVVRAGKRATVSLPGHKGTYQLLSPSLKRSIEMLWMELPPGGATGDFPMTHAGEECFLVISGQLTVVVADQEFVLDVGDSIYIDSTLPHQMKNVTDAPVAMVCASSPPSF